MRALSGPDLELALKAKFLSVGVFCGLVGMAEVVEWADAGFHERASPPAWLMEIAFATKGTMLDVVRELDRIADRGGAKELRDADVRSLLDRLASAIDAEAFGPPETAMALDWLVDNMPANETLTQTIRGEASRFRLRWHHDGMLKHARADLRLWLERARQDPSAAT